MITIPRCASSLDLTTDRYCIVLPHRPALVEVASGLRTPRFMNVR